MKKNNKIENEDKKGTNMNDQKKAKENNTMWEQNTKGGE